MKLYLRIIALLCCGSVLIGGCAQGGPIHLSDNIELIAGLVDPQRKLIQQPEGTPLPPRDATVAANWPPELKELIDNMVTLFKDRAMPPSIAEIETKLKIKLTDTLELNPQLVGYYQLGSYNLIKHYTIVQAPYQVTQSPGAEDKRRWNQAYYVSKDRYSPQDKRREGHHIVVPVLRYPDICLDPYELAVYLGTPFANGYAPTLHSPARKQWGWAYVWGMFSWSETGQYIGKESISINIGASKDPVSRKVNQPQCVFGIKVTSYFKSQE